MSHGIVREPPPSGVAPNMSDYGAAVARFSWAEARRSLAGLPGGRGDDVIKSAGHLIGPFEVESALMEHPAVAEAGVVGVPDPVAGEVVKAFVTLRAGWEASEDLRSELLGFGRQRLGAAVAPREIACDRHLPHTGSGKVVRRLLRARGPGRRGSGEGARR